MARKADETNRIQIVEMTSTIDNITEKRKRYRKGFRGVYLGAVKNFDATCLRCTEQPVHDIITNQSDSVHLPVVFLDVKPYALSMHTVDSDSKITETRMFDLSRISYCSAEHRNESNVLAWVYRQETPQGFSLECHAVRCDTQKKCCYLASLLYKAFNQIHKELQEAIKSSQTFVDAFKSTANDLKSKRQKSESISLKELARQEWARLEECHAVAKQHGLCEIELSDLDAFLL